MSRLERFAFWVAVTLAVTRGSYPALCDLWDFLHYTGFPAKVFH